MNRDHKAEFIDEIRERFARASFVALTDYQGATVKEMERVRRTLEAQKIHFRVVKNSLCRIALKGTAKEALSSYFTQNTGVLFVDEDPVAAARFMRDQMKDLEHVKIRVGFFDGDVLDPEGVKKVADLPSREQLFGSLLGTLQEGPRALLRVIQGPARDLLYVLNNYADKLDKGEAA